ncbi:unnamed protein product [Coffea canephora]|uniref:Uncharacterized protein n=1 Tax=Coffea canephora TaxID=49390 RepID=A0A068UFD7_COFCA|nr:unnamed protein product [Coffea canephora]
MVSRFRLLKQRKAGNLCCYFSFTWSSKRSCYYNLPWYTTLANQHQRWMFRARMAFLLQRQSY